MHVIDINVQFAKMKSLEERKEQQKGNLEKKKLKDGNDKDEFFAQ